jgi:hypothetical protein
MVNAHMRFDAVARGPVRIREARRRSFLRVCGRWTNRQISLLIASSTDSRSVDPTTLWQTVTARPVTLPEVAAVL